MPEPVRRPPPPAEGFPHGVPLLADAGSGVRLRAHRPDDLPAMVEQCRDPGTIRWTTVPVPEGGYSLTDATEFLGVIEAGWTSGETLGWAIEADRDGSRCYCGTIDLRMADFPAAEVGFALHPGARGRSVMSTALRLVRDHALDVLGVQALRWRAPVGNWASRRVAAAAGFRLDGTVRRLLPHRGELLDGWVATLTGDDPRTPVPWLDVPVLTGGAGLRLRPFAEADLPAVAAACSDPRTQHWLVSLPRPYGLPDARAYLAGIRELAARRTALTWCVADADDDRCLGSVGLDGLGGYARRAEVGYWTHPAARGRGRTTEAVRLVTGWAEDTGLVDSLLIRAAAGNSASRHVAAAAGYREVGVLRAAEPVGDGELDDLVLYARP